MQERVLAPWGTVEEVRSSKNAAKSKTKKDKEKSESKSDKAPRKSSITSLEAASKIYSNGKASRGASTSSTKTSRLKNDADGTSKRHSDAARIAKEKQDIKKLKAKASQDASMPNTKSSRKVNGESHGLKRERSSTVDKPPSDARKSESRKKSEGRPSTSRSTHRTVEPKDDSRTRKKADVAKAPTSNGLSQRPSKMQTSGGTTERTKAVADRRTETKATESLAKILPSKNRESELSMKINGRTEDGVGNAVLGRAEVRRGSARSRKGSATRRSESETDNYSDDFNSYDSDFNSDDGDASLSDEVTSSSEADESVPLSGNFKPKVSASVPPKSTVFESREKVTKKKGISARAEEILSYIHLDRSRHLALNLEGMKYDSYMAKFGARGRRQEAIQTVERSEEESQTEPCDVKHIWTQHPVKSIEGAVEGSVLGVPRIRDVFQLTRFVYAAAETVISLLEEQLDSSDNLSQPEPSPIEGLRGGFTRIPLSDSHAVLYVAICPKKESRIAAIFRGSQEESRSSSLAVWDTREPAAPKELLSCRGSPERICWNEGDFPAVIATLQDSTISAWDLRRVPKSPPAPWASAWIPQRIASFSSALTEDEPCHIVGLCSMGSRKSSVSAEGEASVVTLDSSGRLHFWSLIDVQETENELGIAPEETLKLVKAASVKLTDFGGDALQRYTSLGVIDQELYIGRDNGTVMHLSRYAAPKFPKNYARKVSDSLVSPSGPVADICEVQDFLVVASNLSDNLSVIWIYDRASAYPSRSVEHWARILSLGDFSTHKENQALLVNSDHQLCTIDVSTGAVEPLYENVQSALVTGGGIPNRRLILGRVDGAIEVHQFEKCSARN